MTLTPLTEVPVPCELLKCCRFFDDNMKYLPVTADYIKKRFCFGDHESCTRFRIYLNYGRKDVPIDVDPCDAEEVRKIMECLHRRSPRGTEEQQPLRDRCRREREGENP